MASCHDMDLRDSGTIALDLDAHLIIRRVDRAWDLRADSFGADRYLGLSLVGTSLLDHIAGTTTREFYRRLYARVAQSAATVHLRYRCDAPDRIRHMELEIVPLKDGFRCRHHTRAVVPLDQPPSRYAFLKTDFSSQMPWCSRCMAVEWEGAWVPFETAVERGCEFGSQALPVHCTICPPCQADLHRLMQAVLPAEVSGEEAGCR